MSKVGDITIDADGKKYEVTDVKTKPQPDGTVVEIVTSKKV